MENLLAFQYVRGLTGKLPGSLELAAQRDHLVCSTESRISRDWFGYSLRFGGTVANTGQVGWHREYCTSGPRSEQRATQPRNQSLVGVLNRSCTGNCTNVVLEGWKRWWFLITFFIILFLPFFFFHFLFVENIFIHLPAT